MASKSRGARELRPDLQILMMSGYADETIVPKDLVGTGARLLNKPFRTQVLADPVAAAVSPRYLH